MSQNAAFNPVGVGGDSYTSNTGSIYVLKFLLPSKKTVDVPLDDPGAKRIIDTLTNLIQSDQDDYVVTLSTGHGDVRLLMHDSLAEATITKLTELQSNGIGDAEHLRDLGLDE